MLLLSSLCISPTFTILVRCLDFFNTFLVHGKKKILIQNTFFVILVPSCGETKASSRNTNVQDGVSLSISKEDL